MSTTTDPGTVTISTNVPGLDSVTMQTDAFIDAALRRSVRPPSQASFGHDQYMLAPGLEALAERLIERHDCFEHLRDVDIVYLWRAKGGASGGKAVLGKCQKPGGLLAFFAKYEFAIWLAADAAVAYDLSARQIESALFHELKHCGYVVPSNDDEPLRYVVVGHDVTAFNDEVREYGLWMDDLRMFGETIEQLALPLDGAR